MQVPTCPKCCNIMYPMAAQTAYACRNCPHMEPMRESRIRELKYVGVYKALLSDWVAETEKAPDPRTCTQCGAEEGHVVFARLRTICYDCYDDKYSMFTDSKQPDPKLPGEGQGGYTPMNNPACGLRGKKMA